MMLDAPPQKHKSTAGDEKRDGQFKSTTTVEDIKELQPVAILADVVVVAAVGFRMNMKTENKPKRANKNHK